VSDSPQSPQALEAARGERGLSPTRTLVTELALALRRHVLPALGSHAGRAAMHAGAGGDVTFAIDQDAESFLELFLREHAPHVTFYSEDRGLVQPQDIGGRSASGSSGSRRDDVGESTERREDGLVLVVDPIDGTRPAMAGLESCCVSVAAASLGDGHPTMRDVQVGCIVEIKSGAMFTAERGMGIQLHDARGNSAQITLSGNSDLATLFWSSGFRGRPAEPLVRVLGELIDTSSVGGAFFDLGSATFGLTRIVTGQLDAYLEVGSLMIEEQPDVRASFERVGDGAVLNNSPYDLAAAVLCLEEAGGRVTDARGRALGERPLLGSGHEFQMSCLAASNADLHSKLLNTVDRGMKRFLAR
jgi:myo-inositol-1(or 4)-monophosphatase